MLLTVFHPNLEFLASQKLTKNGYDYESIHARIYYCYMLSKLIPHVQFMLHIYIYAFLLHEANNFLTDSQLADLPHDAISRSPLWCY